MITSRRDRSNKTRIETGRLCRPTSMPGMSKRPIQQNKDWNTIPMEGASAAAISRRDRSNKTRIETARWNAVLHESRRVEETDPTKQGLKPWCWISHVSFAPCRRDRSNKTRIETPSFRLLSSSYLSRRDRSNKTRIETPFYRIFCFLSIYVEETDPTKQGLKLRSSSASLSSTVWSKRPIQQNKDWN